MAKGTRFAYLIEFDDNSSLESVSTGCQGFGVKNGLFYIKSPAGAEKILYGADTALTTGALVKKTAGGFGDSVVTENAGKIGINQTNPQGVLHASVNGDAADFYLSGSRTNDGRLASFNLKNDNSANFFRFVFRRFTSSGTTSDEVLQTIFDSEATVYRQIVRFRLVNRMLYFGEDALTTTFFAPVNGFGVTTPSERVHVDGNVRATGFMVGADAGVDANGGTLKAVTVKKGIITAATAVTPIADGTYDMSAFKYIQISGGIITALIEDN